MVAVKKIRLDFVEVEIFEHFVVSTIDEGVTFGKTQLDELFELFSTYYKDRPFVSIANRKNDYTIDPNLLSTKKHPELIGIAVVYYTKAAKDIATFEKKFYPGNFEVFKSLSAAKQWSLELLEDHLKKAGL